MKRILSAGLMLLCAGEVWAQGHAIVILDTNYPEAIVYIDSVRFGPAHQQKFVVSPGDRTLRLLMPGEVIWSVAPVEQKLVLTAGDSVRVSLDFTPHHHIESLPSGAIVLLQNGLRRVPLGETPVTYRAREGMQGKFVLELAGYHAEEVIPGGDVWNRYTISLSPVTGLDVPSPSTSVRRRYRWLSISAAALVVAGGVLTVHHKFKADRLNDEYQDTGDPALRPRIARLDDRAAIALVGMQAGLVTIGVRFYLAR